MDEPPEDRIALVELYQELTRKFKEVGLRTELLENTAGIELFRRDLVWDNVFYGCSVLDSLARAETELNYFFKYPLHST